MYIPRTLTDTFIKATEQFPAVLVTGPRQAGKSTFTQHVLKDTPYVTFDDPLNREFASQDPNGFLNQFNAKPVILDEIQYVPQILQYIKIRIDQNRQPGLWIMTGSQQFQLMKGISETLAGRIAILELATFSLHEVKTLNKQLEDIFWTGLFPEPACYPEKRAFWLNSFVQTYLERDVRQIENIRNFHSFETFINLCAAYHSQEFHPARLAGDCGVSQPTVKSWIKILEVSYMGFILPPFYKNFGKRIIKTPKFYFTDPALVCFLTRQPSPESTLRGSMGGTLFEGLIVCEIWKSFLNAGEKPSLFFWRSQSGLEIDLIVQAKGKFWPIEIKLTSTPSANHVKTLNLFKDMAAKEASEIGILVCNIAAEKKLPGNNMALPWFEFSDWINKTIKA